MLPMLTYIKGIRNAKDTTSRRFMVCISPSIGAAFPEGFAFFAAPPRTVAPYPAAATAASISAGESLASSYAAAIVFASRFTSTFSMPGSLPTSRSMAAEQAAQLMPVMSKVSFAMIFLSCIRTVSYIV